MVNSSSGDIHNNFNINNKMSSTIKIIILFLFIIGGMFFVYMNKITWAEFAGSLAVFNSGILMVEEYLKKKEEI